MIELAFDIAPGASYKFNTAFVGEQASGFNVERRFLDLPPTYAFSLK